ncbi:MAG: response regulator transcription factor [Aliishimia sp.]
MTSHAVLIIEDRPEIATRLSRAVEATARLSLAGVVGTLDQGVEKLFALKPRVMLVDIGLPDGSGVDAIRAAAEADWVVDSLVISIFGDEARVVEAIQAGARGYILKGGDLDQVGADVLSLLDGGSPISPAIARHVLNLLTTDLPESAALEQDILTAREAEILRAISRGYKRREIGEQLGISAGTVGNHITSIYRKLKVNTNMQAVVQATRKGLL